MAAGMAARMQMDFYFSIDKMQPSRSSRPRYTSYSQWLPPRVRGWNELVGGDTTGQWFYYSHQYQRAYAVPAFPQNSVFYKDVSMYFCRDLFWCVLCDATQCAIGDWRSDVLNDRSFVQSQEDTGQGWPDWHLLTFNYDRNASSSFVGVGFNGQRLCRQRTDQYWVPELFPDMYHAQTPESTSDRRIGGLSGDLGLLISLLAFSVAPSMVQSAVETCIRASGWLPYMNAERRTGWIDQRGVVVRIRLPPGVPTGPQILRHFENGAYGHIYP